MRLFVALDLDDLARAAILDEQRRIARTLAREISPRWVAAEQLHLTLVFLGEVPDSTVPALIEGCNLPLDVPSFELALKGLGVFPPRGEPRILWLGVVVGCDLTVEVQRRVAERVRGAGIELEHRAFHPHLTIGRWRTARASDARRALASDSGKEVARVRIGHATLYHSRVGSAGSSYTPLARATLT